MVGRLVNDNDPEDISPGSYLPCPRYLDTFLHLGPRDLAALPPLRLPNVIFLESADFTFAIVLY
jgi:hypothetical protein